MSARVRNVSAVAITGKDQTASRGRQSAVNLKRGIAW
jgi:hypothetical protein